VWRVEWNVTGTMLASSGDDGNVCMWRPDQRGIWALSSVVTGQSQGQFLHSAHASAAAAAAHAGGSDGLDERS
jgi:hypothetical protein